MELASYSPTQITIRPEQQAKEEILDWRQQPMTRRHMADRYRGQDIADTDAERAFFGEDGPSLGDLVDVINPLHHIPFVSSLYSEMTGDTISTAAKIAGATLMGGPVGLIAAVFDSVFTSQTGKGVVASAFAALTGDTTTPAATQVASATSAVQPASAVPSNEELLAYAMGDVGQNSSAIAAQRYRQQAVEETAKVEILPPERPAGPTAQMNASQAASEVMSLYGASASPAQKAYREANMLSYLQTAGTDLVM